MSDLWRKYAPTLHNTASVVTNEKAEVQDGVMVALFPDAAVAEQLAVSGGEPVEEIHLTLAFLGKGSELIGHEEQLRQLVEAFSITHNPLDGEIAGVGVFTAGPKPVTLALPDVPGLPEFRQHLVDLLDAGGFPVARNHGYTPHMTLAYKDMREIKVPNLKLTFSEITVAIGGVRTTYPLGKRLEDLAPGMEGAAHEHDGGPIESPLPKLDTDGPVVSAPATLVTDGPIKTPAAVLDTRGPITTTEREIVHGPIETKLAQTAFVTEVNGKTIVTAAASALMSPEPRFNKHYLTMSGRFVGADRPNRNNAFWTAGDLELGVGTVANGPLNWLHEAKHIIGTISDARYVDYQAATDESFDQPYIQATSQIWRYIWPDEASVVEMASDANRLWYSMECISESVRCSGPSGCDTEVGYFAYLRGEGCNHLAERSTVRHFVNPTFLGGAVIVPPARPGWADADAHTKQLITAKAELAFEEIRPDMTATEWESVMAEVLKYAGA